MTSYVYPLELTKVQKMNDARKRPVPATFLKIPSDNTYICNEAATIHSLNMI